VGSSERDVGCSHSTQEGGAFFRRGDLKEGGERGGEVALDRRLKSQIGGPSVFGGEEGETSGD